MSHAHIYKHSMLRVSSHREDCSYPSRRGLSVCLKVKKSLCVLMQHGACEFSCGRRGPGSPVEYRSGCDRILRILRYPRYISTAKTLSGDTGELVIEEVLQRGHMTMSSTVRTVADRLTHNMEGQLVSTTTNVCV